MKHDFLPGTPPESHPAPKSEKSPSQPAASSATKVPFLSLEQALGSTLPGNSPPPQVVCCVCGQTSHRSYFVVKDTGVNIHATGSVEDMERREAEEESDPEEPPPRRRRTPGDEPSDSSDDDNGRDDRRRRKKGRPNPEDPPPSVATRSTPDERLTKDRRKIPTLDIPRNVFSVSASVLRQTWIGWVVRGASCAIAPGANARGAVTGRVPTELSG
eukprot:5345414-Amphidinium_carterae.1